MHAARALVLAVVFGLALNSPVAGSTPGQVVRVVLFYSPTCPHCQKVISEDMPPILQRYAPDAHTSYIPPPSGEGGSGPAVIALKSDRLELLYVNATTELGDMMFWSAVDRFELPEERRAVPLVLIGDTTLLGELEISEQLPDAIEEGWQAGGVDWPELAGLAEALAQLEAVPADMLGSDEPRDESSVEEGLGASTGGTPASVGSARPGQGPAGGAEPDAARGGVSGSGALPHAAGTDPLGLIEHSGPLAKFSRDPVGNGLAVVVLAGMIAALAHTGVRLLKPWRAEDDSAGSRLVPLLSVAGGLVAGYLTYVETTNDQPWCGPVGNCGAVQASEYARLFGTLPVAAIGLLGYVAILAAWWAHLRADKPASDWAAVAVLAITVSGVAFAIYLTILEPFVIGATCMWCLTSAIIITSQMWLSAPAAAGAWRRLRGGH